MGKFPRRTARWRQRRADPRQGGLIAAVRSESRECLDNARCPPVKIDGACKPHPGVAAHNLGCAFAAARNPKLIYALSVHAVSRVLALRAQELRANARPNYTCL